MYDTERNASIPEARRDLQDKGRHWLQFHSEWTLTFVCPHPGPPQQYPGQEEYYGEQYSHGSQGAPEGTGFHNSLVKGEILTLSGILTLT